jgi:RNA polymerase sigma-54 factor
MKTSLQLQIGQHLSLTPQLQQAIKLLQLSTIDLNQEIQQLLDSNPMLEAEEQEDSFEDVDPQWGATIREYTKSKGFDEQDYAFDNLYVTNNSLRDHFLWQLNLSPMSEVDRIIATIMIDAMNDDGLLTLSMHELQEILAANNVQVEIDEIEAVKHRLQLFDPIGCIANSLAETLLIQLKQLALSRTQFELIRKIITEDLELLGQHHYKQIMKNHQINEKTLEGVLLIIQSLNPKPGNVISQDNTEYVIPDVFVKKINNQWKVKLNERALPALSINRQYASLIHKANNSDDNQFLKNNLQEARWFLKSVQSRQDTLFKVTRCIVEHQHQFLELGEEAMKPLILHDVAEALDLHESTISRVTTQKYMHTPRGVFELKYFFSSQVSTDNGKGCSSTAIRAVIKKLISNENRKKPLSDSKIALLIQDQGIQVARRTVAKYREALGFAPSSERKAIQ